MRGLRLVSSKVGFLVAFSVKKAVLSQSRLPVSSLTGALLAHLRVAMAGCLLTRAGGGGGPRQQHRPFTQASQQGGGGGRAQLKSERSQWVQLIDELRKKWVWVPFLHVFCALVRWEEEREEQGRGAWQAGQPPCMPCNARNFG